MASFVNGLVEVLDVGWTRDNKPVLGEKYEYANWYWEHDTERAHKLVNLLYGPAS